MFDRELGSIVREPSRIPSISKGYGIMKSNFVQGEIVQEIIESLAH